jgi:DNA repair exonuclease SbcCD nuclease subunit
MKLLCFADLQITDGHEKCHNQPGRSLQLWRAEKFFQDFHAIYTEHECDGLVDLGDTTDDRSTIPVPALDVLMQGLARFSTDGQNYKIIGNHEQYLRDGSVTTSRLYTSQFSVVQDRAVYDMGSFILVLVSFTTDNQGLTDWLAKLNYRKPVVFFGHLAVSGTLWPNGQPVNGISAELLKPFAAGLLGHIHKPQQVIGNVHYLGSPFQQDFGESGEQKRVAILETNAMKFEWVPLEGYPQYFTLSWPDFQKAQLQGEDRFKVVLRTPEEATEFYADPKSSHVSEPIYDYREEQQMVEQTEAQDWSFAGRLRNYVQRVPPDKQGISLEAEEMVAYGAKLAGVE